tara:strand:+ start:1217 stop:2893 length:1677 start_codon:yes stop_codon:yes gene_type:complete
MNLKITFKNYIVFSFILIGFTCCNRKYNDEKKFNDFVESFNSKSDNLSFKVNRLSEDIILQQLSETKDKLKTLRKIDITTLDKESQIDYKFIESILVGEEIENEEIQSWKKDPRDYMNFRQISTTINGPKNCEDKIKYLLKYLPVVKSDLNLGVYQLESYVPRFQELGLYMAKNSNSIFIDEINNLFVSCNSSSETNKKTILKLSSEIIEALNVFINFLEIDLPNKQKSSFSIGKETYNNMLKNQFLLDYTDETLWDFGWKEFNNTLDKMDELAKDINPDKTTQEILVDIKNEYPHPDSMIQAHQYWVDKSGEHIKSNKLIPIPWKERVNVVPREEYLRKTSYYGNFSRSRGLDDEGYFTSEWKINPFEHQWDQKTKDEYLVEHDWGVILVTAPHETYAGHHIQGLYQMHNPKELRRNNGLSLFSEGWGLYNEQLMLETGFYPNKKIKLRQLQLRLWRNARVIYDVGMHTGKLSYEDAISLMTDKVGFLRWAAQLEIDSSSSRPGYFIGYFMGMIEILEMREDYKKLKGENYSISDFHEKLLKIGNMPPSIMREALFN